MERDLFQSDSDPITRPTTIRSARFTSWSRPATIVLHTIEGPVGLLLSTPSPAGSRTLQGYFPAMRRAGAQARRFLLDAAAAEWGVPVAELQTEPSLVVHAASGRRMSYGQIAAFADVPESLPEVDEGA